MSLLGGWEHMDNSMHATRTPRPRLDELVPCPHCDGTGEHLEPDSRTIGNPDAIDPGYTEILCGTCDGLGTLDLDEATDRGLA